MTRMTRRTLLRRLALTTGGLLLGDRLTRLRPLRAQSSVVYAADVFLLPDDVAQVIDGEFRMGLFLSHTTDQFMRHVQQTAAEIALDYQIELLVSDADFDPYRQLEEIDALITLNVDALFIFPVDAEIVAPALVRANQAGIPVSMYGGAPSFGQVTTVINSTSFDGGYNAAVELTDALGPGSEIGLLSLPLVQHDARDREMGALQALRDGRMNIVGLQAVPNADMAASALERLAAARPALAGVFTTWSGALDGALRAIESGALDVLVCGFDADAVGFAAFESQNPALLALSAQQPLLHARAGIEALCKQLIGQPAPTEIVVPTLLVTRANYRERWDDLYPFTPPPWAAPEVTPTP